MPCYRNTGHNSLPNDKILVWSKLKAFADDKINVTKELKFVLGKVENIVRKEENAGYQHVLLFPPCFQKAFFTEMLKVGTVWQRVNVKFYFFGKMLRIHTSILFPSKRPSMARDFTSTFIYFVFDNVLETLLTSKLFYIQIMTCHWVKLKVCCLGWDLNMDFHHQRKRNHKKQVRMYRYCAVHYLRNKLHFIIINLTTACEL